jgi:hypothetical protein
MRRTVENARMVTAAALIDLFKQDKAVYVVATYDKWSDLTMLLPDFVRLRPQLLYRQTGFTEDPGKDWVLIANRAAPVAAMQAAPGWRDHIQDAGAPNAEADKGGEVNEVQVSHPLRTVAARGRAGGPRGLEHGRRLLCGAVLAPVVRQRPGHGPRDG